MGLFSKKKRVTIEHVNKTLVSHKIVKLSYLQTLAVTGGLGSLKELAGETEGKVTKTGEGSGSKDKLTDILTKGGLVGGAVLGGPLGALGGLVVGKILGGLFGKKVSREVKSTVKDSGWKVIKSWLQPEFDKIRYAVGIRELTVAQFTYEVTSEMISKPWISPKEIAKVTLIADEFIPKEFPPGDQYIKYYIKPDSPEQDWIRINPVGGPTVFDEEGRIVPRIISFNTERPVNSKLEEFYISTDEPVKSIRLRAVLSRPTSIPGSDLSPDSYTPILLSYRLLMHPRGGL